MRSKQNRELSKKAHVVVTELIRLLKSRGLAPKLKEKINQSRLSDLYLEYVVKKHTLSKRNMSLQAY